MATEPFSISGVAVGGGTGPWGVSKNNPKRFRFTLPGSAYWSSDYRNVKLTFSASSYYGYNLNCTFTGSSTASIGGVTPGKEASEYSFDVASNLVSGSCEVTFSSTSATVYTPVLSGTIYSEDPPVVPDINFNLLSPPSGASLPGTGQINFQWEITGEGQVSEVKAQLSKDGGNTWEDQENNGTSFSAPALSLPKGRVYWRVNVKAYGHDWKGWKTSNITVTYDAVSQAVPINSPTSGNINAAEDRTFSIALQASGPVYAPFTVSAASFFWRAGDSGNFTELAMTPNGQSASVLIPGGTFPSGRIEWYASVIDNDNHESETEVYVLYALQTPVEAAPLSPINTIESGNAPITFRWNYGSLDGTPQSRAQLQYSTDGTTWDDQHIFADVPGEDTVYIAPAGTFAGGTVYWRVRAYNGAGTAGPWSAAVSFRSYAAPRIESVSGDGKPFTTISWQVSEQEAYKIRVDGKESGPYNGPDVRSFTLREPLADGMHSVAVCAQNRYTLWSEWETADIFVQNIPGRAVTITATGGQSVQLNIYGDIPNIILEQPRDIQTTEEFGASIAVRFTKEAGATTSGKVQEKRPDSGNWQQVGTITARGASEEATVMYLISGPAQHDGSLFRFVIGDFETTSRAAKFTYAEPFWQSPLISGNFRPETGDFLIYRDDVLIGKTFIGQFTDRVVLGKHSYYVLQTLPGGYYTKSNTVTAAAQVECPTIEALQIDYDPAGYPITFPVELRLSENADREARVTISQEVAYTQYAGDTYPEAEIGEHRTKSIELDVAALMQDKIFARDFEALIGKDVIVKTPAGEVVIGPLPGVNRRDPRMTRSWTFVIRQSNWRDFVDES